MTAMTDALAWALVHFLWQGTVLAAMAWALMRLASSATIRYGIGVATMAAMVAAVVTSSLVIHQPASEPITAGAGVVALGSVDRTAAAPLVSTAAADVVPGAEPFVLPSTWILTGWALGVLILSGRVCGGWWVTRRLARTAVVPLSDDLQALAVTLARRLHIRRVVRVLESSRVAVPMMLGWIRPVVLLPPAALSGLSVQQIEAILAHEFAHIRRHDYLVNLLQTMVETVLFFHPAVWWLSREVRRERELCCDEVAVGVCDRLTYATALSTLAHLRAPSLALAATDGSLRDRIRRIVSSSSTSESATGGWMAVLPLLLVVLLAVPSANSEVPSDAPSVETAPRESTPAPPVVPPVAAPPVEAPAPAALPARPGPLPLTLTTQPFVAVAAAIPMQAPPPVTPPQTVPRLGGGESIELQWFNVDMRDDDMNGIYTVSSDGFIVLKHAGRVRVAGLTLREAEAAALNALMPVFYKEGVLQVQARTVVPVPVIEAVASPKPGDTVEVTVPGAPVLSGTWVLQADGSLARQGQEPPPPTAQQPERVFFVVGEVKAQGRYEWKEGMTVAEAIQLAGGMTPKGKLGHIMRPIKDESGKVIKHEKIKNLKLTTPIEPGDELFIARKWFG